MAKGSPYNGFTSYLEKKEFTPEFIHDYEYWCRRTFRNWTLFTDFDTFYSICWEALLSKIEQFDPKIATIQTFCISRINNEAWRLYMKNKTRRPEVDCDSPVLQNTLIAEHSDVQESLDDFVRYCNRMGVSVNEKELYACYSEGTESAALLAYASYKMKNKELEGRSDFSQGRRHFDVVAGIKEQS